MTHIIAVGGFVADLTLDVPTWPQPNRGTHTDKVIFAPGGKAVNQAVAAQRLGAQTAIVGCAGNDRLGDTLIATLNDEDVHTSYIKRHPSAETGIISMIVHQGTPSFIGAPRASKLLTPADVEAAADAITSETIIITNFEIAQEVVKTTLRLAKSKGARTILNPAPLHHSLDTVDYWQDVDYLIPNLLEAQILLNIDSINAAQLIDRLLEFGLGAVCITAGNDGSFFKRANSSDEVLHLPAFKANIIDTSGASDAFIGAFAFALAQGWPDAHTLRFASAAAAKACETYGALQSMPKKTDVLNLLQA